MDQAAVVQAITAAVEALRNEIGQQQTVLRQALDKEFGALHKEATDATDAEAISLGGEGFNEWVPVPHGTCHQPNLEA